MTPTTTEQKLHALRVAATKASAHPLMPREAKDAIALLVSVVDELTQQMDWLRRDFNKLAGAANVPAPPPPPPPH